MGSIGILGGSFNPPHLGHLALARHAREQLGLERVLLMPACVSPHKSDAADPGPEHRLEMCRLLIGDAPGLSVCALEIDRGGASYTVDTLEALHASHPDAELTFIVGADTASTLPAWHEPARLLELAGLAVAARAGSTRRDVLDRVASLGRTSGGVASAATLLTGDPVRGGTPSGHRGVRFLEMPVMEVSSSMARECTARGLPIDEIVGPAVARYIGEHGLYGPRDEESG
ncbi:MAG: nicotinate (nicotinamide) nucleotide adenylyltransferase [Solirubrobacterales bacterium]